jgi:hypothetical protein
MVKLSEVLLKAVTIDKPKMLSGLNQKVRGQVQGRPPSPVADEAPPADKHDLTPGSIEKGERSNPVVSPRGKADCKESSWDSGGGMREQANAVR